MLMDEVAEVLQQVHLCALFTPMARSDRLVADRVDKRLDLFRPEQLEDFAVGSKALERLQHACDEVTLTQVQRGACPLVQTHRLHDGAQLPAPVLQLVVAVVGKEPIVSQSGEPNSKLAELERA